MNSYTISYIHLRRLIGLLGIALPLVLLFGSQIFHGCAEIQTSISVYYHTPMRDGFIGILCAISFFLYSYRGYDSVDRLISSLTGLFALGVAFFPTQIPHALNSCQRDPYRVVPSFETIHFISATIFFIGLIIMSGFLFTKSSGNPTAEKIIRNRVYRVCAVVMTVCLVFIFIYFQWLRDLYPQWDSNAPVFWLESIALWAFGISWVVKGEMLLEDK